MPTVELRDIVSDVDRDAVQELRGAVKTGRVADGQDVLAPGLAGR